MSTGRHLLLLGGGGHAAVVAESAVASGWTMLGCLDDLTPSGRDGNMLTRLGSIRDLHDVLATLPAGTQIHAAVGDGDLRQRWLEQVAQANPVTIVHPSAIVSTSATIGSGVFIGPLAIVNARARIGRGAILNSSAVIEHDCVIDEFAHVAPGAVLCGNVVIGARTLVGAGAVVRPGISVGRDVTIGAGAVVVTDVPDGVTASGMPARWAGAEALSGR